MLRNSVLTCCQPLQKGTVRHLEIRLPVADLRGVMVVTLRCAQGDRHYLPMSKKRQGFSKVASMQRLCLCMILFCSFCVWCLPAGRHHTQKLQKIFPVAAGDHAQGPACSAKSDF